MMEHQNQFNRRQMLRATGAAAIGAGASLAFAESAALPASARKVLVFLKVCDLPAGFPDRVADVASTITDLGTSLGYRITVTTNGSIFTSGQLAAFDYVVFYTTGNLAKQAGLDGKTITADGEQALLKAIAGGKAMVAAHCGLHPAPLAPKAAVSAPADPYAKILSDLNDIAGALPSLWAGTASNLHIADHKVSSRGGSIGKTPLPLHLVSVQWQDGTDIKTRRPLITLMFASTSPLLKNVLKYSK